MGPCRDQQSSKQMRHRPARRRPGAFRGGKILKEIEKQGILVKDKNKARHRRREPGGARLRGGPIPFIATSADHAGSVDRAGACFLGGTWKRLLHTPSRPAGDRQCELPKVSSRVT